MRVLGIDPGKTGGIVLVDEAGRIVRQQIMPAGAKTWDLPELRTMLGALTSGDFSGPMTCYLERVATMPGQGISSAFTFGKSVGYVEMALVAAGIPYQEVTPQSWTKIMHEGLSKELPAKERSAVAARRLFPGHSFLATAKSTKPHEGLIDAALIAEYGRRRHRV